MQQNLEAPLSLQVVEATQDMQNDILDLLKEFNNSRISERDWQSFLSYPWRDPKSPYGFVLLDEKKVVGFIATIFSPPLFQPPSERLCNISSWILRDGYRARGLGFTLIDALLKSPKCTFTNMSPSPNTIKKLRSLGFVELEDKQTIVTPLSLVSTFWKSKNVRITDQVEYIRSHLNAKEKLIFENHFSYFGQHFLLNSNKGTCYGIYKVLDIGKSQVVQIQYLSNPEVFVTACGQFALWILRKHKVIKIIIENRMLKGKKIPLSLERPSPSIKLYRPGQIEKEEIANTFSEVLMLP